MVWLQVGGANMKLSIPHNFRGQMPCIARPELALSCREGCEDFKLTTRTLYAREKSDPAEKSDPIQPNFEYEY